MKRWQAITLAAAAAVATQSFSLAFAQTEPTTSPTTGPATTSQPATTQASADVTPEAAAVLKHLAAVYARREPRNFVGTIAGDFNVAGRSKTYTLQISGRTDGDGRFFHYAADTGLITSDGKTGYLYDQRHNAFAELQVSAGRPSPGELDAAISDVLIDENPALVLCLTDDPDALLRQLATAIHLPPGKVMSSLVLELPTKQITLDIDPITFEITRSTIDYTPLMKARNAAGVKRAAAVLTYTPAAPAKGSFAWTPPATASQMALRSELLKSAMQQKLPKPPPGN